MAVQAYYDGSRIVPLEPFPAKPNQKIIVTVLDEFLDLEQSDIEAGKIVWCKDEMMEEGKQW